MARAIGSSTPSRTASPKPASPPILRLHNPSILTRARSARSVTSHSHGEGGRLAPFSMANHWLPFTPAHWFPFTPALTYQINPIKPKLNLQLRYQLETAA